MELTTFVAFVTLFGMVKGPSVLSIEARNTLVTIQMFMANNFNICTTEEWIQLTALFRVVDEVMLAEFIDLQNMTLPEHKETVPILQTLVVQQLQMSEVYWEEFATVQNISTQEDLMQWIVDNNLTARVLGNRSDPAYLKTVIAEQFLIKSSFKWMQFAVRNGIKHSTDLLIFGVKNNMTALLFGDDIVVSTDLGVADILMHISLQLNVTNLTDWIWFTTHHGLVSLEAIENIYDKYNLNLVPQLYPDWASCYDDHYCMITVVETADKNACR